MTASPCVAFILARRLVRKHPQLDFGQFLKLPIREMPQHIEVREFLDGPGRAQDRKKFLPCPKHLQIGHI
jgi:hypothetical protein